MDSNKKRNQQQLNEKVNWEPIFINYENEFLEYPSNLGRS